MAKKNFDDVMNGFFDSSTIEEKRVERTEERATETDPSKKEPSLSDEQMKEIAEILQQSQEILKKFTPPKATGRPKKAEDEKLGAYKFTLALDLNMKRYIQNIAWQNRITATQYIRRLILEDRERYYRECKTKGIDPEKDWEEV